MRFGDTVDRREDHVLGLAGFLIYTLGGTAAIVGLVAGVGSGAALYAAVGAALRDALRDRASVAD